MCTQTLLGIALVLLASLLLRGSEAIRCYQCGNYPQQGTISGPGSFTPCTAAEEKNYKNCSPLDNFCVKYVNKKMVVRTCSPTCSDLQEDKENPDQEKHCCQEDGCNHGTTVIDFKPVLPILLALSCGALWWRR